MIEPEVILIREESKKEVGFMVLQKRRQGQGCLRDGVSNGAELLTPPAFVSEALLSASDALLCLMANSEVILI